MGLSGRGVRSARFIGMMSLQRTGPRTLTAEHRRHVMGQVTVKTRHMCSEPSVRDEKVKNWDGGNGILLMSERTVLKCKQSL